MSESGYPVNMFNVQLILAWQHDCKCSLPCYLYEYQILIQQVFTFAFGKCKNNFSPATSGFFYCTEKSYKQLPPIKDTQIALALLEKLLMALRANEANSYKSSLAISIELLGRVIACEVEPEWMVPLLVKEKQIGIWPRSNQ